MKTLRVRVEDYHIRTGEKRSCMKCPVANAITPMLPAGQYVKLDEGLIQVLCDGQHLYSQEMPDAVKDFITAFDKEWAGRSGTPEPFEFDMRIA